MPLGYLALLLVLAAAAGAIWLVLRRGRASADAVTISPTRQRQLLTRYVPEYAALTRGRQRRFNAGVTRFLGEVRIEGAGFAPDVLDRLLVAASAQLVLGGTAEASFPDLREVVLQPTHFDDDFAADDPDTDMLGMVGEELFSRTVVLSREALHASFAPAAEVHVGVHEFAHLLDRADGLVDGVPSAYLPAASVPHWRATVATELERLDAGDSYLDPYAAGDAGELFAVATEHYFLWPGELAAGHPELYDCLRELYGRGPS